MGQIIGGLNNAFGQVRTDAQNQCQGMASFHEQMVDVHRKLGILDQEATRLHQAEIGGLKERCKKIEHETVRSERKRPQVHESRGLLDKRRLYESNMSASCCCCDELDSTIAFLNPGCSCCIIALCSNSLTAGSGSCLGASLNWWAGIWLLSS